MKYIFLRHAKSAWDAGLLDDHDRPLNRRGREAALRLGHWLRRNGHIPELILCSDARRTRETRQRLGFEEVTTRYHADLYLAGAETILRHVTASEAETVLVIGHNPGMAEAAASAIAAAPAHPDFDRYPTCGCTIVEGPLPGRLLAFLVPRDLPA